MTQESQVSRRTFLAATVGAAVALPGAPAGAVEESGKVQTVLGPIDTSKLGFHQSHEHVCCTSGGFWTYWPELMGGREAFIQTAVEKLKVAKAEGLDSFADLTTIDLGRDI